MKMQNLFYGIGIVFIFISIWYFAGEYLMNLDKGVKSILLFCSVIVTFIIAEVLRELNK